MQSKKRPVWALLLFRIKHRPADRREALEPGNNHIVIPAGTVDNEQIAACVSSANNAHMRIPRIKHQVTGLVFAP